MLWLKKTQLKTLLLLVSFSSKTSLRTLSKAISKFVYAKYKSSKSAFIRSANLSFWQYFLYITFISRSDINPDCVSFIYRPVFSISFSITLFQLFSESDLLISASYGFRCLYRSYIIQVAYVLFFFYKHTGKLAWSSICLRFSQFVPEIMLDGILNFKTHFMVWYCVWYEQYNGLF